ncbi:two-component sensor histidine kinase [Paucibacter sp. TC2R-5]|uniref:sensor histidine kinase n=1 Tax=Paucibacter sp. TC2R-5 TaxID=2893555 RepID=UPI0021E46B99|nr:ATP-binding protein [Paucibacter sp. TC2R-5]MCV2359962.1 two-component sensor histidine kinase [Paucibacter sp. TC2R-5]
MTSLLGAELGATGDAATAPGATSSLFGRTFGAFCAVLLLIWCILMLREFHDVRVVNTRNGQASNQLWAEHARMQASLWADQPERLHAALAELEHLREQEWMAIGYEAPFIAMQVWQGDKLLFRQGPPDMGDRLTPNEQHFESDARWLYVEARAPAQDLLVRRWQEVPGDWHFSSDGLSYYARPLFYSLPLMMLVAWLLLRAGFAPLQRIGAQIAQRSAKDLSALPQSPYRELAPVVNSVNGLMSRLQERLEREREFLLDAAHELKTPLAVVQLNAESLQDAPPGERRNESVARLNEGVKRATHTVHQLLALARSGSDQDSTALLPHDLVALVRDRMALSSQLALQRGIELELESPERCELLLNRESIGALVDNLVDNAVKYSPAGSLVRVAIAAQEAGTKGCVVLSVSDQGPGIPIELRRKVFERFFRLPDQIQSGSGLGLAIVERAAAQHGAAVTLSEGPQGCGLTVQVQFKAAP